MSAATIAAWARTSRFASLGLVLDLRDPDTPELLRRIESTDALRAIRLARMAGRRFVVLAGQLLRTKAGCFAGLAPDAAALPAVALAAAERLTEAGETNSLWFVLLDEPGRTAVIQALASACGSEGEA